MARLAACSTGDLGNNVDKLRHELQQSKYAGHIDARAWRKGNPSDLLPLIHFALLGYSKHVHDSLVAKGYDLFAKTDVRFLEAVYKLLRQEFAYRPQRPTVPFEQLRVEQFFAEGFVERKVILVHDILKLCQRCHADLQRELKGSQRDGASGRAFAVHSGSGLSSLAASTSQKPARPLVEKGPPPGGKKGQLTSQGNVARGSGGLLNTQAFGSSLENQYVEDEDEGLQPRAMRPPAPHPIISAQNVAPFPQDGMQSGAASDPAVYHGGHQGGMSTMAQGTGPVGQASSLPGRLASMDWSDSQQADYSTYSRELPRREAEQGWQAALNFTTAVHTSVSPKRRVEGSWGIPNHGSHSWFPVEEGLADARERLYRIDSEGGSQDSASPALHYQELKMRVDDLCARMDKVQGQLVKAADADQRVARLEEEYSARLLLTEGRIRFLEKRIAAIEDPRRDVAGGESTAWLDGADGGGGGQTMCANAPAYEGLRGGGGKSTGSSCSGNLPTAGLAATSYSRPPSGNLNLETATYTAGGGGRASSRDSMPKAPVGATSASVQQCSSYPGASAMMGGVAPSGGADISGAPSEEEEERSLIKDLKRHASDEKLHSFISSIRARFRETHELLLAGQADGGAASK